MIGTGSVGTGVFVTMKTQVLIGTVWTSGHFGDARSAARSLGCNHYCVASIVSSPIARADLLLAKVC